jgi:hypothetical protein
MPSANMIVSLNSSPLPKELSTGAVASTWYGMYLSGGEETETVDGVEYFYTGHWPDNRNPKVIPRTLYRQKKPQLNTGVFQITRS